MDFDLIKLVLEIKSSFPVAKLAPKADVNLVNQHCQPAEELAVSLTNFMRHLDSQGTRTLQTFKPLKALGYSKDNWVLGNSRHLSTWAPEARGTQGTFSLSFSGTWALGHLKGTWTFVHIRGTLFSRLKKM